MAASATAAVGFGGAVAVGCGDDDDDDGSSGGGDPARGGTLRGMSQIDSVLDPHRTNTPAESTDIWGRIGNFLVRLSATDPVGFPEADLAESLPEVPDDGTTLTFKIRSEAKWHDRAPVSGRSVTAEDVKLTIERIQDPDVVSPRAGTFANIESVTVIDERTAQFKLKKPQADLLNILADQYNYIIPSEIAGRGAEAIKGVEDVIGSGPYELTSYKPGEAFTLERRADGYWREDSAWLDGFEYIHQVEPQRIADGFRSGQVDYAPLVTVDVARSFADDERYQVTRAPIPVRECLLINHNLERYQDVRVRKALWSAIDRQQVYDQVFGGAGKIGGPMTPAAAAWVLPDSELLTLPGFRDREIEVKDSRSLLEAAGYPDGFEETVLTVSAFDTEKIHDVVVSSLADVGINVITDNVGTDFAAQFLPREVGRDYNLATTLFLSGAYPDAQLLLYHHTNTETFGTRNYGDYGDAELDAMLEQQSTIYDTPERVELVQDIQRRIVDNPGPVWMGSREVFSLWRGNVRNARSLPFAAGYYVAEHVWLE